MDVRFALLAGAMLAGAPFAADAAGHEAALSPQPAAHGAVPCASGETLVFSGDVQDDFGLGIAVCVSDEAITIRYSGEGDPQAVSCRIGECAGIIDFDHYVRYRLTIITLTWRDDNGQMRLTESLDAQHEGDAPRHIITHAWVPPGARAGDQEPQEYPVIAYTQALSLIALSGFGALSELSDPH